MPAMKTAKRRASRGGKPRTKRRQLRAKRPQFVCVPLQEYTQHWGELTRLAKAIGEDISTLSLWRSGWRQVPIDKCAKISRATGGYVSCEALRPDFDWST